MEHARQSTTVAIGLVEVAEFADFASANAAGRAATERALDALARPLDAVVLDGDIGLPERELVGAFGREEGLEQVISRRGRESGAAVGHDDVNVAGLGVEPDLDPVLLGLPLWNRLSGVDEEVDEHLPEAGLHGVDQGTSPKSVTISLDASRCMADRSR